MEEDYVYLDGMTNVKFHHDLVLKFRDKLEGRLTSYSSGYTRQSFTYDNFEFYLEFSLGYVGTKILSGIRFVSGEPNAPTTALSKMRDEFTVTSGSKLFYTTGNNFYIRFTLEHLKSVAWRTYIRSVLLELMSGSAPTLQRLNFMWGVTF